MIIPFFLRARLDRGEGAPLSVKAIFDPSVAPTGVSESTKVGMGGRLWTVELNVLTVVFKLATVAVKVEIELLMLLSACCNPVTSLIGIGTLIVLLESLWS